MSYADWRKKLMTVEEIYSKLASHMIQGLMTHEQLANYYDFLGLKGYKRCHEYHYLDETCNYRKLCRYFINHHSKLIPESDVDNPEIIPSNWYRYERQDVDNGTKVNAIKNGITLWVNWEKETKKLYEEMYEELININEVASAMNLKMFICGVDEELKCAERKFLDLKAIDYSLEVIIPAQHEIHEKYKKKMKELEV